MKLITLKLENFQGIKSADFDFGGMSASIYGDNATGKTTIFNAVTWLLFDRASTGAKNYTPKTKGSDGDLHYLDHTAEARFDSDGRHVTLRKVYHENYKKKRGSATEEFDGHGVDYFVDGVPTKEKDFQQTLLALGGSAEKMKMLTMPNYFSEEMKWEDRRKILLEICGDVDDDAVIASTSELAELSGYLAMPGNTNQHYTVDEYKKIASAKKTDINKQLQGIPGRIDEAQRAMPDITGLNVKDINSKIKELNTRKNDIETEKAQALAGNLTAVSIRNQISEANTRLAEARAAFATKNSSLNEGTYTAIGSLKKEQIAIKNRLQDAKTDLERTQRTIERLNSHRDSLVSYYMAVQKEAWDEGNEVCPSCHRPLPEEEIQKLREAFNLQKSKRLEKINLQGQKEASKEMIAEQSDKIKELKAQIKQDEPIVEDYEQQISALQSQLQAPAPFESTEEYAKITAQIAAYRDEVNDTSERTEAIAAGFTEKIQVLYNEIRAQEDLKTRITIAASQKERIAELEAREKELAAQYEELEHGVHLCELFIKTKVNLLTSRINDKFKNVRFRLFIEQINGGLKEDCEVMIPAEGGKLVPFAFANNAARINAGLEIINTLSHHWGIEMPVLIDNAESVTNLLQMDTQVIRLVVSEQDKKMRIELGKEKLKKVI